MLWRRHDESQQLPKVAVCYVDSAATRAMADALARLGECDPVAILADTPQNILWLCAHRRPDLLLLEAVPDAMARYDDPDKDISGRCELAAQITEVLPDCRVYLTCAEEFRRMEPVMQKAVETELIDGYCFGDLTERQLKLWLGEKPGRTTP